MIRINFDPSKLGGEKRVEWDALTARADIATGKIIQEWEEWRQQLKASIQNPGVTPSPPEFSPKFDDDLWKDIRNWLLENVFSNKCGYCETPLVRSVGDSEHFRPKGRVSVPNEKAKQPSQIIRIKDEDGNDITHPGYFWLAYNWKNLLPACEACNRYGKRDLFPVQKSHVAVARLMESEIKELKYKKTQHANFEDIFYLEPEDLDRLEGRLLLHPYYDSPEEHLVFGFDGSIHARNKSVIGEASITIYRLKDPKLEKARRMSQAQFLKDYGVAIVYTNGRISEKKKAAEKILEAYIDDGGPYISAILDHVHENFKGSPYDLRPEIE